MSQGDKEKFVRTTTMRLQQQQLLIRAKLDRAYDDRLSGRISDELWNTKSAELESELQRVRGEMASRDYEATGVQILELAQGAYSLYVTQNPHDQAKLIKTLLSNCTFDCGSLTATYVKPFDLFAKGAENGDWLLGLDSNQQPSGEQVDLGIWPRWFFSGLAALGTRCYPLFGSALFTDCSRPTSVVARRIALPVSRRQGSGGPVGSTFPALASSDSGTNSRRTAVKTCACRGGDKIPSSRLIVLDATVSSRWVRIVDRTWRPVWAKPGSCGSSRMSVSRGSSGWRLVTNANTM